MVLLGACGGDAPPPDGGAVDGGAFTCPDPRGCPTGCCDGTSCQPGDSLLSCGVEGDTCRPCADGSACVGGACRPAACEASCAGCCTTTGCEAGTSTSACGSGGNACTPCIAGEECSAGSCECVLDCEGRVCGPDGCGGECGAGCDAEEVCNAAGTGCETPGCTSCTDCGGDEACLFGRCQSLWGRTYRVTMVDGTFPERTAEAACWDTTLGFGCGLPDPTAMVSADGASWRFSCAEDSLGPEWTGTTDLVLERSDALHVRLVDEDVGGAFGCDGFTNDAACGFFFTGPDHPEATPESTQALRDTICLGSFDRSLDFVCDPGFAVAFTIVPI